MFIIDTENAFFGKCITPGVINIIVSGQHYKSDVTYSKWFTEKKLLIENEIIIVNFTSSKLENQFEYKKIEKVYISNSSDTTIVGITIGLKNKIGINTPLFDNITIEPNGTLVLTEDGLSQYPIPSPKITTNIGGSNNFVQSSFIAGETLSGGQLVYSNNGQLFKYNNANLSLYGKSIGFTKTSALTGETLDIVINGECDSLGGLIQDNIYYASTNGSITSTIPTSDIFQPVGIAKNATTLIVNFQKPYIKTAST